MNWSLCNGSKMSKFLLEDEPVGPPVLIVIVLVAAVAGVPDTDDDDFAFEWFN